MEKNKRKRGKRLNLLGKEGNGCTFWGPDEILAARELQATQEATIKQKQTDKAAKKAQDAIKKLQDKSVKAAKALQKEVDRQVTIDIRV